MRPRVQIPGPRPISEYKPWLVSGANDSDYRTSVQPPPYRCAARHSGRIDRHDYDELVDEFVQRCTELTPSQAATINLDGLGPPQLTTRAVAELGAERARLQALVGLENSDMKRLVTNREQAGRTAAKISRFKEELREAEGADSKIAELTATRLARYSG